MTVLDACRSALIRTVKVAPSVVFSSTDPTVIEMADLVNEVGTYIMKKHQWQALTRIHEITGDGVTASFPAPADYDRMLSGSGILDPMSWAWGYTHISDVTDWLVFKESNAGLIGPGAWILMNDQFHFLPALPAAQQAQFPYISKFFVRANNGTRKGAFNADSDSFVLSERLLTLGLVWKWLQQKGFGNEAQAEVDFHTALDEDAARDKGARTLGRDRWRPSGRFSTAYPWRLG